MTLFSHLNVFLQSRALRKPERFFSTWWHLCYLPFFDRDGAMPQEWLMRLVRSGRLGTGSKDSPSYLWQCWHPRYGVVIWNCRDISLHWHLGTQRRSFGNKQIFSIITGMGSRERAFRFLLQCLSGFSNLHALEVIKMFPERFLMAVISVALKWKLKPWHLWWCMYSRGNTLCITR